LNETPTIRLVGCQGSIQLLTAIHAIKAAPSQSSPFDNHLWVYELFAPASQDVAFFKFIKSLAEQSGVKFTEIRYLDSSTISGWNAALQAGGIDEARRYIAGLTGVVNVDEVFLGTQWQPVNKLVLNCFPQSKKICYGDSIGLHIPSDYFFKERIQTRLAKNPFLKPFADLLKKIRGGSQGSTRLKDIAFDEGYYFTDAMATRKPAWPYKIIGANTFKANLDNFVSLVPEDVFDSITDKKHVAFLMTSNFCEAGRMSEESEIEAYTAFVQEHHDKNGLVIIKPHPRDGAAKLKSLATGLEQRGYNVSLLNNLDFYFLPFELFLQKLEKQNPERLKEFKYFTFSTACLSIRLLFQCEPLIGLGDRLVERYFYPQHQALRKQHERDLRRLLTSGKS
jgi:hypothetical protein